MTTPVRLPRMFEVRQNFPPSPPIDVRHEIEREFAKLSPSIKAGQSIAVGVGSRGISNLEAVITAVLEQLKKGGARPFIIPAMGSHGGATPEGQCKVLASYGISEEKMKVPVRASLDTRQVGEWKGAPVFCSTEALAADGVVLVNRVKPHTDFGGPLGSGLIKMTVIGLGKRDGATAMHAAASRCGHEQAIRGMAGVLLRHAPIVGGIAILENQFHDTARIAALGRDEFESGEEQLQAEARRLMPLLPFDDLDLLIVDRLGKNISGAGMDPNVTGRGVQGYSGSLVREGRTGTFIRRIFVRDLSPETHGNAIGIGLADITTTRLVRAIDHHTTAINALTALTPQCAKIPIHFDTDREAIEMAIRSLALPHSAQPRIAHIRDTLALERLSLSEVFLEQLRGRHDLSALTEPAEISFDAEGQLKAIE